jgi:hypothetical protein
MDNFYVYMYLRSKNSKHGAAGTPYYVGKGRRMRAYSKEHRVQPPVDQTMIVFAACDLSEPNAHAEEIRLIAFYGRIDNGTGCLRNLTDGGEGVTGRIQPEEERRRRSEWMKAHPNEGNEHPLWHTPEARAKAAASNRGRKSSPEYCRAQSERMKGKSHPAWNKGIPRSEEQRRRHSELMTGRSQRHRRISSRNTSGFKGVYWAKDRSKWRVSLTIEGVKIQVGSYCKLEEAKEAYRDAVRKYHGEYALAEVLGI